MSDHQDKLNQELKYIETKYQNLAGLHFSNGNNYKMLVLGVLLGLIGGLFATLLYELVIANWSSEPQWIIFVLSGLVFAYFIYRFAKEMRSSREKGLKVKQERDEVMNFFNSVRKRI